jgi:hypothetical protein
MSCREHARICSWHIFQVTRAIIMMRNLGKENRELLINMDGNSAKTETVLLLYQFLH